jgi:hypothetical protein
MSVLRDRYDNFAIVSIIAILKRISDGEWKIVCAGACPRRRWTALAQALIIFEG